MLFALAHVAIASVAPSQTLSVTALDGSVTVNINTTTGVLSSIAIGQNTIELMGDGMATLEGTITLELSVTSSSSNVVVKRLVCIRGGDVPCSTSQALLTSTYVPRATSVGWVLNASSPVIKNYPVPLWSRALVTNVTVRNAADKKFWAPWERNDDRDALSPSDGGWSWWNGEYLLGAEVAKMNHDLIIHEQATILAPLDDIGFSVIPNPANPFAHPTWLNTTSAQRGGGAGCATPTSCAAGPGGFAISRHNLRFGDGAVPHVFDSDIVAHHACWREALGWSTRAHAAHWEPVSKRMRAIEGLGSYSSYLGDLTDTDGGGVASTTSTNLSALGYTLNWDLSGRFFPYAGQFLPPLKDAKGVWLNDAEGTQTRANVSYASIDAYYSRIQKEGFHTLSYWNVFEYGENVCTNQSWNHYTLPACKPPAPGFIPSSSEAWANSTNYMRSNFPDSLVTCYDTGGHSGYPNGNRRALPTWQGGVVVDPVDPKLQAHWIAQLNRKYDVLPHFEGLVVDRSDWNSLYNFDYDDGHSFIQGKKAHLAQYSYVQSLEAMRDVMAKRQSETLVKETVMLQNALGFAQLSLYKSFDGTFSEGHIVNAAGILGARSSSILWTANGECCKTDAIADVFFQRRLYMDVYVSSYRFCFLSFFLFIKLEQTRSDRGASFPVLKVPDGALSGCGSLRAAVERDQRVLQNVRRSLHRFTRRKVALEAARSERHCRVFSVLDARGQCL